MSRMRINGVSLSEKDRLMLAEILEANAELIAEEMALNSEFEDLADNLPPRPLNVFEQELRINRKEVANLSTQYAVLAKLSASDLSRFEREAR